MKILVKTQYSTCCAREVDLPEVVNWSDVKHWCVKWGVLHYTLNGEDWNQIDLEECIEEWDMKHPDSVNIMDPVTSNILDDD